jgi:hypothetical protein
MKRLAIMAKPCAQYKTKGFAPMNSSCQNGNPDEATEKIENERAMVAIDDWEALPRNDASALLLDHPRLRQHHQLGLTQTQFATEDLDIVLTDERGTAGNAPGRLAIQRGWPGINEASPQLRM